MSLPFFNVRSGETRIAETEPQIAALWGSSDRGPNARKGQDFGWRLAPEIVVMLRKILADERKRLDIAKRYNLSLENVGEKEVLRYISEVNTPNDGAAEQEADYTDQYEQEIRDLSKPKTKPAGGETKVGPSNRGRSKSK